jgi:hypothetical protein
VTRTKRRKRTLPLVLWLGEEGKRGMSPELAEPLTGERRDEIEGFSG